MREKLNTLPVAELRTLAKSQGIKGTSGMRKGELVDALMEIYEKSAVTDAASASETEAPRDNRNEQISQPEQRNDRNGQASQPEPRNDRNEQASQPEQRTDRRMLQESSAEYQENRRPAPSEKAKTMAELDSGTKASGILEVLQDGYGFLRCSGYLPGEDDVYIAPSQIKRFNLKTGDLVTGGKRIKGQGEKLSALLYVESVNGTPAAKRERLTAFENLTPVFPHERLHLESGRENISTRIVDLLSPIGKGQRGMIVAQPKVGKTTLLKAIASALLKNHPELHIIVLLIDERPEEVTDMKESIVGDNVEIVYSTFDELPEHHKRVSEMVIERARRLVECGQDVVILLDSITRLTRAYNITVTPSGRTLSGGLDPAALYMPKRFFGAARCMREGGSLTILATALVETGSRLDDMVYEEFKGTGNMELVLNRKLSERRIFPAIDILKSSTRRDDLLLTPDEQEAVSKIRKATAQEKKSDEAVERVLDLFQSTGSNAEFIAKMQHVVL